MHMKSEGVVMGAQVHSGNPVADLPDVGWWKSSYSNPSGNCVEMAWLRDGRVGVRDSRFPGGGTLIHSAAGMRAFVAGVQAGRLGDFRP